MKIISTIALLFSLASAKDITMKSDFEVFFPIFGKIGEANATLVIKDDSYKIDIFAYSVGIAKFISSNKTERYESIGVLEDGLLVPNYFKLFSKNSSKSRIKEYFFNHKAKQISMIKNSFRGEKLKNKSEENLSFYAKNDLTTLYFNLKNIVNSDEFSYELIKTAGANSIDGGVEVFNVSQNEIEDLKNLFENFEHKIIKVIINQEIFASEKGELYLNLNKDYICKEAILKDVILFGDIRAKLVNFTLIPK